LTEIPKSGAEVEAQLVALLTALNREDARGAEGQRTVELDQQAVGRLSRMDALQNQAMARAQAGRRAAQRHKIHAALARLASGDYGYCTDCGDALLPERLAADPAVPRCLYCTKG